MLLVKNNTDNEICIEQTVSDNTIELTTIDPQISIWTTIGYTDREKDENYPSDVYVNKLLQNINIYRKINDSIQQLPKHYYDEHSDFSISTDYFMSYSEIIYAIDITEDMFSE